MTYILAIAAYQLNSGVKASSLRRKKTKKTFEVYVPLAPTFPLASALRPSRPSAEAAVVGKRKGKEATRGWGWGEGGG